jgi:hypothetical protein
VQDGSAAEIPVVPVDEPAAAPAVQIATHRRWRPAVAVLAILTVVICAVVVLRSGVPPAPPPAPPSQHTSPRHVAPPPGGFVLPSRDVYPLAGGERH